MGAPKRWPSGHWPRHCGIEARYDGGAEIRPDMRVVALAEAWFQSLQDGDRSATTLAQYRYRLDHQVIPALGELRVRELTAGMLDRHLTAIGKKHGAATAKMGPHRLVGHVWPGSPPRRPGAEPGS